jgi:cytochrome c oxidase assembly factor CtaG
MRQEAGRETDDGQNEHGLHDLHGSLPPDNRFRTLATVEASRQRFRPILMTSFAFILGIVPLLHATGAGAASRRSLGTAVFGGMIAATVLAVFFVPVFYVLMQRLTEFLNRESGRGSLS